MDIEKTDNDISLTQFSGIITEQQFRDTMMEMVDKMREMPDSWEGDELDAHCPLVHLHGDGLYIRQITMYKGQFIISKIHKFTHPYFVMKGDVSVLTDKGVVRIKAPYNGITEPGTQRALYIHEDTVWITCHATDIKEPKEAVEYLTTTSYDELDKFINKDILDDEKEESCQ